jgi:hypothetical protein
MIKHKKWPRVGLIIASVFLTVIGSEIILRVISHTDIDGNVYVADRRIRLFQGPNNQSGEKT